MPGTWRAWCFKWLKQQGGLEGIGARNQRKSGLLYDYLDGQSFYRTPWQGGTLLDECGVHAGQMQRSMPISCQGAQKRDLIGLKGHRSVGGMRASLYNAVPESAVRALVEYMKEFAQQRG